MERRALGWTDLSITRVGLGTFAQGGAGWSYAWGPQDDRDSIAAIRRALELGVNWVDTAPAYGLGHAEEILGSVLRSIPPSRRPLVATKCGRDWNDKGNLIPDLKGRRIRREIEASLRRLGLETIDLYQIHWPQPQEDLEEAWSEIAAAVKRGQIRYAGVSNFNVAQMERLQAIHPIASLQPPYSLLRREAEDQLLPFCSQHRIGVIAYSPMQKGLLTGAFSVERVRDLAEDDHRRRDPLFHEPQLSPTLRMVGGLAALARREGLTTAQLAIGWVLRRNEVTAAIVGARNPAQIEETAAAGDLELDGDVLEAIAALVREREAAIAP